MKERKIKSIYLAMQDALGVSQDILGTALAKRRLVPIIGEINSAMSDGVIEVLVSLDLKATAPITLLIASNGGSVPDGRHICGIVSALNSPVDGLVIRNADSMAVDILLHCRKRLALPTASFFLHFTRHKFHVIQDSDELSGKEIEAMKKEMTECKATREALYAKRLGKKPEEIHDLFRRGEKFHTEYFAEEALKLGIIDEVVKDFKFWTKEPKSDTKAD